MNKRTFKMVTKRLCKELLKLSVFVVIVLFLYLKWTGSGSSELLTANVNQIARKYLSKKTGGNSTNIDKTDFDMNERQQYDLRIICIVYNRAQSILRLLNSINEAEYYNDNIKLEVWIDCSKGKEGKPVRSVVEVTNNFTFRHGSYSVHQHPTHVGIYGQWLSTWKPVANSSEIALILEDDLVVSPLFYKYLNLVHKKYDSYSSINGYSLQGISMKHGGGKGWLEAPYNDPVFVYPVLGSWGFSPITNNWIKFLKWYHSVPTNKRFRVHIPGNMVSGWYNGVRGPSGTIWTIWHIYFAWKNNEVTLYPNFEGHYGLTANMYEPGLHFGPSKNVTPSNRLLKTWKPDYENLPDKPVKLDLKGNIVKYGASTVKGTL